MMNMNSKQRLMRAIQAYSFAVYDTHLYLDAYPDCQEAKEYYNKYSRMLSKAVAEYESKYGHITPPNEVKEWTWTDGPWPWQMEGDK